MTEKVFLNDKLVDVEQASVSVTDSGLLYGAGLFETMRSHNGVVFRLEDHLDRLFLSAASLSIRHDYDKNAITEAVYGLLRANDLTEARLRLTLTNGPIADSVEQAKPTLLISATPLQNYPTEYYQNGIIVVLCSYRQNTTDPICGHKTTNYYPRLLALTLARQKGRRRGLVVHRRQPAGRRMRQQRVSRQRLRVAHPNLGNACSAGHRAAKSYARSPRRLLSRSWRET